MAVLEQMTETLRSATVSLGGIEGGLGDGRQRRRAPAEPPQNQVFTRAGTSASAVVPERR